MIFIIQVGSVTRTCVRERDLLKHLVDIHCILLGIRESVWLIVYLLIEKSQECFVLLGALHVLYQTRERVFHQDIQTPRSGLKKRGAAEFF